MLLKWGFCVLYLFFAGYWCLLRSRLGMLFWSIEFFVRDSGGCILYFITYLMHAQNLSP